VSGKMKNIITVVGARPNFMKAAPFLRSIGKKNINSFLVHTGQHYDKIMSDVFFDELDIQKPDFNLEVGSASHAQQTASIMVKFEMVCNEVQPDLVVVLGDINSTMACAIVAKKLNIKVVHIEAGLRSEDRAMPEEINRVITDSISDYFFVTEKSGIENLLKEGQEESSMFLVGNLMIDNLFYGLEKIKNKINLYGDYGLITLHRPSNVDNPETLKNILSALNEISNEITLFFSMHPRTKNMIKKYDLKISENIKILEPQSYLDFLLLMRDSKIIFTDSGGIQEESTILKIPCYTLRNNTERPITITQGTNHLIGTEKNKILNAFQKFSFSINKNYKSPKLWDGKSADRIAQHLIEILEI
jgi:UDP-N-acetylglucosamine 2-epimerase (non-hydrolysing)